MSRAALACNLARSGFRSFSLGVCLSGCLLFAPILSLFAGLPGGHWIALLAGWIGYNALWFVLFATVLDLAILTAFSWQRIPPLSATTFAVGLVGTILLSFKMVVN